MPNRPIIVIQNISKSRAVRIKQDGAVKLKRIMNSKNRTKNHRTLNRPFVNLGIGIGTGIGTDITNAIISSSIRPMDPNLSRVVT